jgi:hypothetical protein
MYYEIDSTIKYIRNVSDLFLLLILYDKTENLSTEKSKKSNIHLYTTLLFFVIPYRYLNQNV